MTGILLVTGGSRGIGAATAKLAAARGYAVGVNYKSDARAAASVVDAITKAGGRAVALQGDMSRENDVERVFAELDSALGRLTHLVYNSGITGKPSRVDAASSDTLREVMDVNVLGAFYCVRAAVARMSAQKGGQGGAIVLLSSVAPSLGAPGEYVWYAASKGAIDAMTLGLGKELAPDRIRVNAVAPGLIDTEIHMPGRLERMVSLVPMQRIGTAEEVAEPILFLLSDAASYITSTVLRIGGGR
jgi:NAD(P)-dependent dehydrogenase (short-subunit alcohol dehydrogenase family)